MGLRYAVARPSEPRPAHARIVAPPAHARNLDAHPPSDFPAADFARAPRAFLGSSAQPLSLAPGEAEHVLRVLRLRVGDALLGLDGAGGCVPLRIRSLGVGNAAKARGRASEREALELAPAGSAWREPAPGEAGAALPWIELAIAWPKPALAEAMLDRLVQLGAAAIVPLECEHAGPQSSPGGARRERLERILREACKQSRRAHLPQLHEPLALEAYLQQRTAARGAWLEPGARTSLPTWLQAPQTAAASAQRERPLTLAIGPEGGFSERERAAFERTGWPALALGPHVLRIETAAEAAMAVAAAVMLAAGGRSHPQASSAPPPA